MACLLFAGAALGSSGTSRAEYVEAVEKICKQGAEQHGAVLKGVNGMVRREELKAAGHRFDRAAGALLGVIRRIAKVERPEGDVAKIKAWLGHGKGGARLLKRIGRELKANRRAAAEARADRLLAEIRRANATVIGFDFQYCRVQPARFV